MEIMIRRNWWGRFLIYENDNADYSYRGYSMYLWGRGNFCKIFNRAKEQVLYLKQGRVGKIWKTNDMSYLIKVINENIDFELKYVDHNSHWTFSIDKDKFDLRLFDDHNKLFKNNNHVATYRTTDYDYRRIIKATDENDKLILISLGLVFQINND